MSIIEKCYRGPWGRLMSVVARAFYYFQKPAMLYGYTDPATGRFNKYVRISSTTTIVQRECLSIGDHVWIWHNSILDATGGLTIGEGCQIGACVGVFTHGSNNAIRLLGRSFVDLSIAERHGYIRKSTKIGEYTFIGSGSVVMPGVSIGKGCVIGPNCFITRNIPDRSVVVTCSAKIEGNTMLTDANMLQRDDFSPTYYDPELLQEIMKLNNSVNRNEVNHGE